ADCGRSPAEMAEAGGSMVHIAAVAGDAVPLLPFAQHEPDYTIVSTRGPMVLDDCLADLAELTQAVTANAPAGAPTRWEEATWVTCEHCEQRVAVSVRPDPAATPADDSTEGQPGPAVGCAACGEAIEKLSTGIGHGFTVQLRGQALADPEPNGGRQPDGE
ncbi:MAG TPA: hypothetical protein QGH10_05445, partial [Armatimonadota bacterium]|nr:hypothetical protein [Armatimonadota bacterium]